MIKLFTEKMNYFLGGDIQITKKNSSENLKNKTRYFFYNIYIWLHTFLEINNFIESWYIW